MSSSVLKSDVDIVIELIGGLNPAEQIVRSALESGKSVVTANKQLIARHGPDLLQLAASKGCQLEFGASVAGGVPVLPALRTGLCGDRLHGIAGILNGTCNYILSRIENARIPFSEALEEAQARGYAEADASEDLDGGDARAKLAILALAGLHARVEPESIRARTIRRGRRGRLRLCGGVGLHDPADFAGGFEGRHAVRRGRTVPGCGRLAVRTRAEKSEPGSDVRTVRRRHGVSGRGRGWRSDRGGRGFRSDVSWRRACAAGKRDVASYVSTPASAAISRRAWYLRFFVRDQPGIVARLAQILAAHHLNIDSLLQKPGFEKASLPFVITLEPCRDSLLHPALRRNGGLGFRDPAVFVPADPAVGL